MFEFVKTMASVMKDEIPESQDCGCGPRKGQSAAASSCCGPIPASPGNATQPQETQPTPTCAACTPPAAEPAAQNPAEPAPTSTASSCGKPPQSGSCSSAS
jgi:hypothetical protein